MDADFGPAGGEKGKQERGKAKIGRVRREREGANVGKTRRAARAGVQPQIDVAQRAPERGMLVIRNATFVRHT